MATVLKMLKQSAVDVYRLVCRIFDKNGFKYEADEANLAVASKFDGDDLPITIIIGVNDEKKTIQFICKMMFEVPLTHQNDIILALNDINSEIMYGRFVLNRENGWVTFEYSYIYRDAKVTEETLSLICTMMLKTTDLHDGPLNALLQNEWKNFSPVYG